MLVEFCRRNTWIALALCLVPLQLGAADSGAIEWRQLEAGLELAEAKLAQQSSSGDSVARIVRADPARFALSLLNASADPEGRSRTARGWAREKGLVAVTNAAMYQRDGRTSVSLMRSGSHVNNARLSKDRTVLAFDRRDSGVPEIQIIDRTCQDFDDLSQRYGSLVQSIRMISCRRGNVWSQQEKAWSTSAVGTDEGGRLLLIHVRSPYTTHDLIDNLLALGIGIKRLMYLEGGAPSQLYLHSGEVELDLVGSHGSSGIGGNRTAIPIPNALGLSRRE